TLRSGAGAGGRDLRGVRGPLRAPSSIRPTPAGGDGRVPLARARRGRSAVRVHPRRGRGRGCLARGGAVRGRSARGSARVAGSGTGGTAGAVRTLARRARAAPLEHRGIPRARERGVTGGRNR